MRQDLECTIKEASEILNIPTSTLRYWEDLGLIYSHRLPESNYRTYSLQALFQASNIAFYRKMGVSIKQIEKMKSRTLEDVVATYDKTAEKIETEINRLQRALKRLNYQRFLSEHALDLIQNGVREATPIIARLNAYNPESQWQRKLLVRDMQRYALYIDVNQPEEMIESYAVYPEGSIAEEDALGQEGDAPVRTTERKSSKKKKAKKTADQKPLSAGLSEPGVGEWQEPHLLWDRATELEKGVDFFEGVAFSESGKNATLVRVEHLFDQARKKGRTPLYAIAHFLVEADFNGRKDCYQVWIGCEK